MHLEIQMLFALLKTRLPANWAIHPFQTSVTDFSLS